MQLQFKDGIDLNIQPDPSAGLRCAETDIDKAVFFAVELNSFESFGSIAGGEYLDFLVFKKIMQFSRVARAGRPG